MRRFLRPTPTMTPIVTVLVSMALLGLLPAFLCAADCNGNGIDDLQDVSSGASDDCNSDGTPDECQNDFVALGTKGNAVFLEDSGRRIVATDLDGDGLADLAIGSQGEDRTSRVSIYLSRTAGSTTSFEEGSTTEVGRGLVALAPGDLDGDGAMDLVAAGSELVSEISVLWNDGSGSFSSQTTLSLHGAASALAVADLDGDGTLDVAVSARSHDMVAVFSGRPGREFDAPLLHAVGDQPVGLVSADFDRDGRLDLVTANNRSNDLSILKGEGNRQFRTAESLSLEAPLQDLVTADLDGDGRPDLVASSSRGVFILRNEGGEAGFGLSTFAQPSMFARIGDFDGDTDLDVVVDDPSLSSSLPVLVNEGDGSFRSVVLAGVPSSVRDASSADLDGDGDTDLAVITAAPESFNILWNGEGEPITVETRSFRLRDGRPPHALALADLDGDGDLDVATGDGLQLTVSVMTNDGRGNFTTKSSRSRGTYLNSVASADFDQDGDFDLVLAGLKSHQLVVLDNNGDAEFPDEDTHAYGSGHNPFMVTTGDLDGDGFADIVSANQGEHTVTVLLNDGSGRFPERSDLENVGTAPDAVAIADLDGDGHPDLAVSSGTDGQVAILLNEGDGSFRTGRPLNARGDSVFVVAGDWNRDGTMDLATANQAQGAIAILLNRGGGNFEDARLHPLGQIPYSLTTTDFNGDGKLDLVSANQISDTVSVLINRGDGSFFSLGHYPTGIDPRIAAAGDVDGDGDMDIISANHTAENITVIYNGSPPISSASYSERLCTLEDFRKLAIPSGERGFSTKYIVPARNAGENPLPTLFQNSHQHALHHEFLRNTFPDRFPSLSAAELRNLTEIRNTRRYFVGSVEFNELPGRGFATVFTIVSSELLSEALSQSEVAWVHDRLAEAFSATPLLYAPDPTGDNPVARERAESWTDAPFEIHLGTLRDSSYEAYTTGVGYGRVRLLSLQEFREANLSGRFTLQDIPVIGAAPTDIEGVVGGVVTASIQPVTSHVAIRTARRRTPNAYIADALEVFAPYDGVLVRLEVRDDGYQIDPASEEEAAEFWDEVRPELPAVPDFDPDYRALDSFEEMDLDHAPETRYGGKASNLARLQRILDGPFAPYRERGFAIPMAYYFDFLDNNLMLSPRVPGKLVSYREHLEELASLKQFQTDSGFRFEALQQFRNYATVAARVPPELVSALATRIEEVFGKQTIMVRFRSSSNVEDLLEFNGAGLYESTSVCAADSFDADDAGPSLCNGDKDRERTIEAALVQVWTSLWTFRAQEERSFYRILPEQAAMGILVNRAFPDERVNGVAFTGDPTQPRGNCYVVTAQIDEISVVHPDPGVLPERSLLEMVDGRVVRIVRAQRSTMVAPDEVVMTDAELEELGAFMWHADREFPIDPEGHPREDVLLDFEFKIEADDSLAVKQVRPFLTAGQLSSLPVFELEIPPETLACGGLNIAAPSRSPRSEYEAKSVLRFRSGVFELPARYCVFPADLIDEVVVGTGKEIARPQGPGLFRVDPGPDFATQGTRYTFRYEQRFSLDGGRVFELRISNLSFVEKDGIALPPRRVLDEEFITFDLKMLGFLDEPPTTVAYGSCADTLLPVWDVHAELADGSSLFLKERFLPEENVNLTGRASVEAAELVLGGRSRLLRDYWKLVYSSSRHNTYVSYWTVIDPPLALPGLGGAVHVVQLEAPDDPELLENPQPAGAAYLDADFNVLSRVAVSSFTKEPERPPSSIRFLRGDASGDGLVDLSDAITLLYHLYLGESAPSCLDAADANDDGLLDTSDPIQLLAQLFLGEAAAADFGVCSEDASADALDCGDYEFCL